MRLTASRASITSSGGAVLDAIQQEDPTLDLNFEETKTLTDDVSGNNLITFSRASSGTYVDSDGLIKTSPVNLFTYSEQFDQSDWSKAGSFASSQVQNAALAPDGTQTAEEYQNLATGINNVQRSIAVANQPYVFSIYLKAKTASDVGKSVLIGGHVSGSTHLREAVQLPAEWTRFTKTGTTTAAAWSWGVDGRTSGTFTGINVTREESSFYIWGAQLEEGTTATDYIPTGATISGAPRFDHDPVTGESLGLLIEESRTNLINYSEEFDNIYWNKFSSTSGTDPVVTPNYATAPDGTLTADRIVGTITPTGGADYSLVRKPITTSGDHTWSIWLKSNTGSNQSITIKYVGIAGIVTVTPEWQRFSHTTTQSSFECDIGLQNEGLKVTSNSMDILAWGAQLEEGSFPTSYIPTTSSTVTRAADLASITGTNFSSWFNQSEGTVFVEAKNYPHPVTGKALVPLAFSNNTYNNRITLAGSTGTAQFNFDVTAAGSFSRAILGNFVSSGLKASGGYKSTGSAGSLDGAAAVTSNTPNIPSVIGQLDIGRAHDGNNYLNGHISRLAYFPTRKTDQELINLTKP